MKKITLMLMAFFTAITISYGQADYQTGIGVRGGLSNGITIKHFLGSQSAIEGIAAFRWGGYNLTGLYEIHTNAFDEPQLNFYYGAGGHIGFWDGDANPWFDDNQSYTVIGIDGILGLEYTFKEIPINLSLDWKPGFNLVGDSGFWGDEAAFSARFVF